MEPPTIPTLSTLPTLPVILTTPVKQRDLPRDRRLQTQTLRGIGWSYTKFAKSPYARYNMHVLRDLPLKRNEPHGSLLSTTLVEKSS